MRRTWVTVAAMAASTMNASADSKDTSARTGKSSLPSEFFIITRQCKQLMSEIGSSNEATQPDHVMEASSSDYLSFCLRTKKDPNIVQCSIRFKDKDHAFASSGSKDLQMLFAVVANEPPLMLLQDVTGGNAMYINTQSRDAVLTSRQYFNLGGGATAKWLAANVKVCKAMLLDEQDVNKLSKE